MIPGVFRRFVCHLVLRAPVAVMPVPVPRVPVTRVAALPVAALLAALSVALLLGGGPAQAQDDEKPYEVHDDGSVDWYTFSGYRRYHSECHVCHGPDGLGSSFAPNLVESLKTLDYGAFLDVVVNGRQNVDSANEKVMPSFGVNRNVMCFIDDLYAYLKARADGALERGRPKHAGKPAEAVERDDACMG